MLPSGHFAVGYLVTKFSISSLSGIFPQANEARFWVVGMLAAVLVDLDEFYSFYKIGRPIGTAKGINHRKFFTHAPLFHLFIGLVGFIVGLAGGWSDLQLFAILYVAGMWSHFFFDSFGYGIMWLWPFSRRIFAFHNNSIDFEIPAGSILEYWGKFLKLFVKDFVFYLEIAVITLALLIKFKVI